LSGFPNRVYFTEVVQRALEAQKAGDGTIVTIAYLDIDRFKDINDTLGHHAGDELIKSVTARLRRMIDKDDFLARFGGDELAILRISKSRESTALAGLLMSAFTESFDFIGQNIRVSASIGIVRAPEHGSTVEDLMRNADIALYRAKADGRDRAVSFTEEMGRDVQLRRAIEVDLRGAIERDQLELYYQPIVSSRTSRIVSVEALLRWRHPEHGDISPARFIPIAEEAGLMPALGAWVIERAMTDHAMWPDIETSINLSPDQFRHTDIAEFLAQAARRHGVETSKIVLEITESLLLEPSPRVRSALQSIRQHGFKIALDDFGTGYSSLTYLRVFHFDKLKIDRSFITESPKAENTRTIVQSIVSLGRSLGMEVIAEGVETEAEFAMMRMFGCSAVQGYYFSKPVPRAECEAMVRKQREINIAAETEAYGASVVGFGVR
jgi:diguanylate cyclase (GGDEF)-like protein